MSSGQSKYVSKQIQFGQNYTRWARYPYWWYSNLHNPSHLEGLLSSFRLSKQMCLFSVAVEQMTADVWFAPQVSDKAGGWDQACSLGALVLRG